MTEEKKTEEVKDEVDTGESTEEEKQFMLLNAYQFEAGKTILPSLMEDMGVLFMYCCYGLGAELGEFQEILAKSYRGDFADVKENELNEKLAKELGDILWFVSVTAACLGYDLDTIAKMNLFKLTDRQKRGVLAGSGDNR
jgi:NTP pyrophosphatase (non-canonical NTP hydrolase)